MINLLTFDNLLPSLHSCQNLTNLEKNDGGYHVFPPHRDFKAPSTHIRFHLKKAIFSLRIRLPSRILWNRLMKTELLENTLQSGTFWNAIFACTWRQTQTELFENAEVTLSVPSHSAQYKKLIQDGGRGVKHAQSGKLSFSNRFIVYVWTGENDAKTLRVDADFLKTEKKKLRFQTNTDTCWQGLRSNDATATRACKTKQ